MNGSIPDWMKQEVMEYDLEMAPAPVTVLDIGANVGAFALAYHAKWPEAVIRCYEPVSDNFNELLKNTRDVKKILSYKLAVRSFNGRDSILIGDRPVTCGFYQLGRQSEMTQSVFCCDGRDIPPADLVKIDTEGCEVEILERLDLRKTRALVVEYHRATDLVPILKIASEAGLKFLGQTPGSSDHGVLKFGREGTKLNAETQGIQKTQSVPAAPANASLAPEKKAKRVYVAVCAHFSNHDLIFVQSMMQLLLQPPCPLTFGWSCDASVERARNILTKNFLESDCTHLLFIDGDIGFMPLDVARVVSHDVEVVGGSYPLKTSDKDVQWCGNGLEAVGQAQAPVSEDGLQEVGCIGTGFMFISRRCLEKILETDWDKIFYQQDWPPHREELAFWSQTVREVGGKRRFLTEDWNFCYRWRELGGKVFADTRVVLRHAGRAVWPLNTQSGNPFLANASPEVKPPANAKTA